MQVSVDCLLREVCMPRCVQCASLAHGLLKPTSEVTLLVHAVEQLCWYVNHVPRHAIRCRALELGSLNLRIVARV